ncbi:MAG: sialidase family protein, partial [Anaerolineae bacterium]
LPTAAPDAVSSKTPAPAAPTRTPAPTAAPEQPAAGTETAACAAGDPDQESPLYDHQVFLTSSPDAFHFEGQGQLVVDHASVPDGVVGPDGKLWVYFVNGRPGQHGIFAARETDSGQWEIIDCIRLDGQFVGNAVDPDVTRLPDGRYRLVYFLGKFVGGAPLLPGQPHPIYSAISADGLNFTVEQELIAVEGVTDPSLVQLPDGRWLLALAQQRQILLAASDNGYHFELTGVTVEVPGIPELALLPDGRLRLYLSQSLISEDGGQTWTVESDSQVPGRGADPSLVALPGGGYAFFYKSFANPPGGATLPTQPPAPIPSTVVAQPTAPITAAAAGDGVYGIFSFPADERSWQALDELGVSWVRLQYRLGEAPPALIAEYGRVFREGYGLWLTLYPRDASNVLDPVAFEQSTRGGFPPADADRYMALVTETLRPLVEEIRAAGQSPADWLVVQLGNEVLPSDVAPEKPIRFWHGTSDEYLHTLALTGAALDRLDPDILLAAGGISSEALNVIVAYENDPAQFAGQPEARAVYEWNERLLAEGKFDWLDVHLYHKIADIPAKVAWVRARWSGPLAATEIGGPDPASGAVYSPELHVADLSTRIPAALAAGVDRVFWTTLVETPAFGQQYGPMALITADWQRKPAFETYRQMIASP